jgi:hypothetical protein
VCKEIIKWIRIIIVAMLCQPVLSQKEPTTMSFAAAVKANSNKNECCKTTYELRSLCTNSDYSERLAFQFLGFKPGDQIATERALSALYPKRKVPDAIFNSKRGNVAVEVKRVKNVIHKDTVNNALEKVHADLANCFNLKEVHVVFQTRENGQRDKVPCVLRDVHGIIKKTYTSFPYMLKSGVKLIVHVQKVGEGPFQNIGF